MACLVAVYKTPKDPAAFDRYYFATHVPLAKKMPGLRKFTVNKGAVFTPTGPGPVHLIGMLHFDDITTLRAALSSPEGRAAAADLKNFADGGVDLWFFDERDV